MTAEERFMRKVSKFNECWHWIGAMRKDGYGAVRYQGKMYCSHKVSFMIFNGAVPKGLVVRHTCDDKRCVNPEHLILGTQAQNMQDKMERGKAGFGEENSMVRLTDAQIRAIKEDPRRHVDVAPDYGVTASHIGRIRRNERRAHGSH